MRQLALPTAILLLMGSAIGLLEYLRPEGGVPTGMAMGAAKACVEEPERCEPTAVVLTLDGFYLQKVGDPEPPRATRRTHRRIRHEAGPEVPDGRSAQEPGERPAADGWVGGLFAPHADVVASWGPSEPAGNDAVATAPDWDIGVFLPVGPSAWAGAGPESWVRATPLRDSADEASLHEVLLRRLAGVPRLVFACEGDALVDGFTLDLDFQAVAAPQVQTERCAALPDFDVTTAFTDGAAELRLTTRPSSPTRADAFFACRGRVTEFGHRLECSVEGVVYGG